MRRDTDIGKNAFGFPQRQINPDHEVPVRERNLAGRHLGAKLRDGWLGDVFRLVRASGIYLDDFAGDDLADRVPPVDQTEKT
jgi:hypothetical protein